jgi:hypothetical protein
MNEKNEVRSGFATKKGSFGHGSGPDYALQSRGRERQKQLLQKRAEGGADGLEFRLWGRTMDLSTQLVQRSKQ